MYRPAWVTIDSRLFARYRGTHWNCACKGVLITEVAKWRSDLWVQPKVNILSSQQWFGFSYARLTLIAGSPLPVNSNSSLQNSVLFFAIPGPDLHGKPFDYNSLAEKHGSVACMRWVSETGILVNEQSASIIFADLARRTCDGEISGSALKWNTLLAPLRWSFFSAWWNAICRVISMVNWEI